MSETILIANGKIIDPVQNKEKLCDLLIANGKIAAIEKNITHPADIRINASGLAICPGFIDLHCHLREPGFEYKETIASGATAAARGGFTTICCMPNTEPALDNRTSINYIKNISSEINTINIFPVGCITKNRAGQQLSNMTELADAGCIGFSDDGSPVSNPNIMALAMRYSTMLKLPIIEHCEDKEISQNGQMNDDWVAARLGLKGISPAAEESMVARNISLSETTGAHLHVTHISTAGSVELVRIAKKRGLNITADVTPHHLTLTSEQIMHNVISGNKMLAYDTNAKVNPPLRSRKDVDALVAGINDGTIDAIATDHAPHSIEEKLCEFDLAPFGISGFETAFGVLMQLVHKGKIKLSRLIECLTAGPASILKNTCTLTGSLLPSSSADIVLIDTVHEWKVDPANFASKGKNTPYAGLSLKGAVVATISKGKFVYNHPSIRIKRAK